MNNAENEAASKFNTMELTREQYGNNFHTLLIEQYKLYVEMHDRISARRNQMNGFYISLLSGLLALLSIGVDKNVFSQAQNVVLALVGILGVILCFLWRIYIRSYARLVWRKIQVIHEIEKYLPFPCYLREEGLREKDLKSKVNYTRHTTIEQYTAITFGVLYFGLFLYAIVSAFK